MSDLNIPCMILSGGQSRRFGDTSKEFAPLAEKPMIAHIIERVSGQAAPLAINAMPSPEFSKLDLPVIPDINAGGLGPLIGVLTAMHWAKELGFGQVLTCSNDTPFIPLDWARKLRGESTADIIIPRSGGRHHHICALWSVKLDSVLEKALENDVRKVGGWLDGQSTRYVDFPVTTDIDPFFNVNSLADLQIAENEMHGVNRQ